MNSLIDSIHEHLVERFNPIVAEGVSVAQMEKALQRIDNAFKLAAQAFPPELKYEGYKECTVMEEYQYLTNKRNQNHTVELAPSDVYMVNFTFSWNGEKLPAKPIFIPFLNKAGRMMIRGKRFTVLPVLADKTISVSKGDIFVPFLSAKITFKRMQYWFKLDGQQRTEYLVYSTIHNHKPSKQPRRNLRADLSVNCQHAIPHYLFCKFGVREAFRRFFDAQVEIIEGPVDYAKYPPEKYAVCSSSQLKPRSVKNKYYQPTDLKIIIDRNKLNPGTLGMVNGFFYVVDHFADRFTAEYLDGGENETRLWCIILGKAIFRNNDSEGKLYNNILEHLASLDLYVDDDTREGLSDDGHFVDDIWDLMAHLIFHYTEILLNTDPASMYGKMLEVNRYVLADIIKAVSLLRYRITSIKRELSAADVNKYLNRFLKPELIFNGFKNHNEIVSVQCAGDNIMFNYTSRLILQENATGKSKRKAPTSFKDPSKLIHSSIAVAGSILALPKAEPTGKVVLNPYLPLDYSFKIKTPTYMKEELDYIQQQIRSV